MAISTTRGHVSRAISFFNSPNMFFGFGRQTPWNTDDSGYEIPHPPEMSMSEVEEPIGFKAVDSVHLVVPDPNGTIIYRDTKWTIVSPNDAYDKGARYIYLKCSINYDELPLLDYRQIGILTGLERAEGVEVGKMALRPEEVEYQGILQIIDNRRPTLRQVDQKEELSLIIEF